MTNPGLQRNGQGQYQLDNRDRVPPTRWPATIKISDPLIALCTAVVASGRLVMESRRFRWMCWRGGLREQVEGAGVASVRKPATAASGTDWARIATLLAPSDWRDVQRAVEVAFVWERKRQSRIVCLDVSKPSPGSPMQYASSFVVLSAWLCSSAAAAQPVERQLGVDAGVLRATLVGNNAEGATARTAPVVGATFVLQPAGFGFGLLTGVYYAQRGARQFTNSERNTLKLTYLEIPLLGRYLLPVRVRGTQIGAALLAGFTVGVRSGCSIDMKSNGSSVSVECANISSMPRVTVGRADVAASGGAEMVVPVSKRARVVPSIRFNRALIDFGEDARLTDRRNSAVQIGVGVRLSI
jgi:hypothetical protein